jgi:hypothetical protein
MKIEMTMCEVVELVVFGGNRVTTEEERLVVCLIDFESGDGCKVCDEMEMEERKEK